MRQDWEVIRYLHLRRSLLDRIVMYAPYDRRLQMSMLALRIWSTFK